MVAVAVDVVFGRSKDDEGVDVDGVVLLSGILPRVLPPRRELGCGGDATNHVLRESTTDSQTLPRCRTEASIRLLPTTTKEITLS